MARCQPCVGKWRPLLTSLSPRWERSQTGRLQGPTLPEKQGHLRRTLSQPSPAKPRSIAISFQDINHKKQPGSGWVLEVGPGLLDSVAGLPGPGPGPPRLSLTLPPRQAPRYLQPPCLTWEEPRPLQSASGCVMRGWTAGQELGRSRAHLMERGPHLW